MIVLVAVILTGALVFVVQLVRVWHDPAPRGRMPYETLGQKQP